MPFGSRAVLSARIVLNATGEAYRCNSLRFKTPTPCSALKLPPSRTARSCTAAVICRAGPGGEFGQCPAWWGQQVIVQIGRRPGVRTPIAGTVPAHPNAAPPRYELRHGRHANRKIVLHRAARASLRLGDILAQAPQRFTLLTAFGQRAGQDFAGIRTVLENGLDNVAQTALGFSPASSSSR